MRRRQLIIPWLIMILLGLTFPTARAEEDKPQEDSAKASASQKEADDKASEEEEKAADKKDAKQKSKKAIPGLAELRIDEKTIAARALNLPIPGSGQTVQDLLERMKKWEENEKVAAVLLDLGPVALSLPDVEELRGAIKNLSANDKKVVAFLNSGNANAYLLAAAADEIAMAPTGSMEIAGIGRLFAFEKGYHEMMGNEFQVITAGKYKYPGFLNRRGPDEFFNEEFGAILDSWFDSYVNIIADGRELEPAKVRELINQALSTRPRPNKTAWWTS